MNKDNHLDEEIEPRMEAGASPFDKPEWEESLFELVFWQGRLTSSEVRDQFVPFIKQAIEEATQRVEKAFGGCKKCLGIKQSGVARVERNKKDPSLLWLFRFCQALDIRMDRPRFKFENEYEKKERGIG